MTLFRNVFFVAALSGLFAGVLLAAVQTFTTVPLILQAETFENAAPEAAPPAGEDAGHEHDEEEWAPADGFERFAWNVAANIVSGIGFALVLVAVSEFLGGINGWRQGLFWGLAGFAIFTLAPGLGLPPELPAMPAADLAARQVWWIGTVLATGAGLALIAFRRELPLAIVGVALLVVPHVIGAPQPPTHESPVPPDLHHQFVVAVTLTNLVFWVALGAAAGFLRNRFLRADDGLAAARLA